MSLGLKHNQENIFVDFRVITYKINESNQSLILFKANVNNPGSKKINY